MFAQFNALALGTRFQYDPRKHGPQERTWVKIHVNLIAEWNPSQVATSWIGQSVCSFNDKDDFTEEVFVVS